MNILHINASDISGGAARAAYRIHRALVEHGDAAGIKSSMRVITKLATDPSVIGGYPQGSMALQHRLKRRLQRQINPLQAFHTGNPVLHSPAWPDSGLGFELKSRNQLEADLLHLHWLGNQTLSIEEIGRLQMPLVWTLHDQWAFCGAEHYTNPPVLGEAESSDERFALGYTPESRLAHEGGPDLNRITWLRKKAAWLQPIHIVCPSNWLAECARRSALMSSWPISVIPYPVDLNIWAPWDQAQARELLGLPQDRPLALFGADGGAGDPRKGADLLVEAMRGLHLNISGTQLADLELLIYGQSPPDNPPVTGFPIHYVGRINDDLRLRLLYAAVDVFVIPSRQDNLPNTGIEAHACGTPVVAFRTGGLVDIVEDRVTGALAKPFDPVSLADAIRWVLENPQRRRQLGTVARKRAEMLWDPAKVASLYGKVYREATKSLNPHS